MLWVGRIAGGIVGFAVAIVFTEVVFRSARDTAPLGVTAILIVLGVFAGSRVALHFRKEPSQRARSSCDCDSPPEGGSASQ